VTGPIETNLQIEETAAAWVAKRESGAWQVIDQAALDVWLSASTAHRVAFLRLHTAWEHLDRLSGLGGGKTSGAANDLAAADAEINVDGSPINTNRSVRSLPYAWAATLVIACTAGGFWYLTGNRGTSYETKIGEISNVSLADGTTAVIDSVSKLTVRMNGRERRVELERGGIFLSVAKDATRPFVVDAGDRHLTDEGTQFAVRQETDELIVLVTEGMVHLATTGSDAFGQANIAAGSEAHAFGGKIQVAPVSEPRMQELLSWRTGHLVFHDAALSEAVAEFNRYSKRRIVIQSPSLRDIRIGGSFRATDVDGFLSLLKRGFPVQVEDGDAQINLTHR